VKKIYPELPNWEFDMDEVSANVYEVVGKDNFGHRVSSKGLDLETLIEECKKKLKILKLTQAPIMNRERGAT
jgi:hypothetical protein